MKKFSVLELLHPDGIASTSYILGSNCPENLRTEQPMESNGDAELFILAPSVEECISQGWLEAALKLMSRRLSQDGVGYVLILPRWRWRVIRWLHHAGLLMESSFWHFPSWSSSRYLVPIAPNPA